MLVVTGDRRVASVRSNSAMLRIVYLGRCCSRNPRDALNPSAVRVTLWLGRFSHLSSKLGGIADLHHVKPERSFQPERGLSRRIVIHNRYG